MASILRYRIHWDGDSIVLEGATIEELRAKADAELTKRGIQAQMAWSEQLR